MNYKSMIVPFLLGCAVASLVLFVASTHKKETKRTVAQNNIVEDLMVEHDVYTGCTVFEYERDGIYTNERFGFRFSLPSDMLVCEEREDEGRTSITLLNKKDFHASATSTVPVTFITIQRAGVPSLFDQLPKPTIVKQEEVTIDGVAGTRKELRSPSCVDKVISVECPVVKEYEFVINGYSISIGSIGETGEKYDIVGSLKFNQ